MMSNFEQAAGLLWECRQEGRVLPALPEALRPATRAEGYAIQAFLEWYSEEPILGWRIGAASLAEQAQLGIDAPLAGRILAEQAHGTGALISLAGNRMQVGEPAFAFQIARTLPPRAGPYQVEEVMAAVGALHPAIELPDSCFADRTTTGAAQLLADNACARDLVLGPATTDAWRDLDLGRHQVMAQVSGQAPRRGSAETMLGGPCLALAWLAGELSRLGLGINAGELVVTGTGMAPLPVRPGEEIRADFGVLGRVSARLAAA